MAESQKHYAKKIKKRDEKNRIPFIRNPRKSTQSV